MAFTESTFMFYGPNEIESIGVFSILEYDSDSAAYTLSAADYSFSALLDRDKNNLFEFSGGSTADAPNAKLHVTLPAAVTINTIIMRNINFEHFQISYNGFAIPLTILPQIYGTAVALWDDWSDSNLVLQFGDLDIHSIDILVHSEASGSDNYEIGAVILAKQAYQLPRNPNFAGYKPKLTGLRIGKKMADGGYRSYQIKEKFSAEISLDCVPGSVSSELRDLYETDMSFNFCPYPTTTAWDGDVWEVNWINDFEFLQPAVNDLGTPLYRGKIKIAETPA